MMIDYYKGCCGYLMNWTMMIGLLAAMCSTVAFLPQVIKTLRTKQTKDISLLMYIILTMGISFWLTYGLLLKNPPLILANGVTLIFAIVVLILKIKHG